MPREGLDALTIAMEADPFADEISTLRFDRGPSDNPILQTLSALLPSRVIASARRIEPLAQILRCGHALRGGSDISRCHCLLILGRDLQSVRRPGGDSEQSAVGWRMCRMHEIFSIDASMERAFSAQYCPFVLLIGLANVRDAPGNQDRGRGGTIDRAKY